MVVFFKKLLQHSYLPLAYRQCSIHFWCRALKENQYWVFKYNAIIGNNNDNRLNVLLKIAYFNADPKKKKLIYFKDTLGIALPTYKSLRQFSTQRGLSLLSYFPSNYQKFPRLFHKPSSKTK